MVQQLTREAAKFCQLHKQNMLEDYLKISFCFCLFQVGHYINRSYVI